MALSTFSVGGLMSGLDTTGIIRQLMDLERAPIDRMHMQKVLYQARVDAWGSVKTRLSGVTSKADALKSLASFDKFTKVSSSSEAVKAAISGTPAPSSLSFTVDALATAHQAVSAGSFSSGDAAVGAGTFTISAGGQSYDFATTSETTLSQLAKQINDSGAGVGATVVSPDGTNHRLILTAKKTGAANQFTTSGTQASLATFNTTQTGTDSKITIGTGAEALVVTRSSNVITDLIAGVSLTLTSLSTTAVTVDVTRDLDAAVKAVKGFVDEVNRALGTIGELTKYDAEAKKGGLLQGDPAGWGLAGQLRDAITKIVTEITGDYVYGSSVGITLQRDGTFALDESKLRAALDKDHNAVARLFARAGSATDARVEYIFASDTTKPGTYGVQITQAAQTASVTGAAYASPAADETFTITSGATVATVVVKAGNTLAQAVTAINDALSAAGIASIKASDSGGAINLSETRYGSKITFSVAADESFSLNGTFAGADVAGTINGHAATGTGQLLRSDAGASTGLQVRVMAASSDVVAAGGTLALGNVVYSEGIAGRTAGTIALAIGDKGSVAVAGDRWKSQIKLLDERIAHREEALVRKEALIRMRFTAMEAALAKFSAQGNWLAAHLGAQASK